MIRQLIKLFIFAIVFIPITKANDTDANYEFNKAGYIKFTQEKSNDWVAYLKHQKQTMQTAEELAKLAIVIQYGDYNDNGTKLFGWTSFTKATSDQTKALTSLYLNTAILAADSDRLSEINATQEKSCLFNNKCLEQKFNILQKTHPYILKQKLFKSLDITYETVDDSCGKKSTKKIINTLFNNELNLSLTEMQKKILEINSEKLSFDTHNNRCDINKAKRLNALSQLLSPKNINEIEDVEATEDNDIILTIAGKQISQNEELKKYKKEADAMYMLDKTNRLKNPWNNSAIEPLSRSSFDLKSALEQKTFLNKILLLALHPNTYYLGFSSIKDDDKKNSVLSSLSPLYPDLKEITMQCSGQITQLTLNTIVKMKNLELFHFSTSIILGEDNAEKLKTFKDFLKTITNQSECPSMKDIYVDQLGEQLLTNNNGTREEMKGLQKYIESLNDENIFN